MSSSVRKLIIRVLQVVLVVAAGGLFLYCKQRNSAANQSSTVRAGDAAVVSGDACGEMCRDTSTERTWAVCYSCRCKEAMGGFLPPPRDLDCDGGEDAKKYVFKEKPDRLELIQSQVNQCMNPERLYYDCNPGHRVVTRVYKAGKLTQPGSPEYADGDVIFRKLCKRERFNPDFKNPALAYNETAIIGFNMRTGAACFWDDRDNVVNGHNQPDLDLTAADDVVREQKVNDYLRVHYKGEGDMCVTCHDNDPFMFDPSYISTNWYTNSRITSGPYYMVRSDGSKKRVGKHLVSFEADACTQCHRITGLITPDDNTQPAWSMTCKRWLADAIGEQTDKKTKQAIMIKGDHSRWGSVVHEGRKWSFPYWMPDYNFMDTKTTPPQSKEEWESEFGEAVAHIKKCCTTPYEPECKWAWIPTEAKE